MGAPAGNDLQSTIKLTAFQQLCQVALSYRKNNQYNDDNVVLAEKLIDLVKEVSAEECLQVVQSLSVANKNGSILNIAARFNHYTLIEAILTSLSAAQGFNLLTTFSDQSPLHTAAAQGHGESLRALLQPFSSKQIWSLISLPDKKGRQPKDVAPKAETAIHQMLQDIWMDALTGESDRI